MYLDFDLFAASEHKLNKEDLSGQGEAGILIAFEPGQQAESSLGYLEKILKAAGIDMKSDAFTVSVSSEQQFRLDPLELPENIRYFLLFGVHPRQLSLHFVLKPYHPTQYNGITYLKVDALTVIQQERAAGNNQKAGLLWQALQQIFIKK